jgi:hypothetical protein
MDPAVRRTDTLSQSKRDQPELRGVKKDICKQSRKGGFASKVAKLWQVIRIMGRCCLAFCRRKLLLVNRLHPAWLEPATL